MVKVVLDTQENNQNAGINPRYISKGGRHMKCTYPVCIYYHEVIDKSQNPSIRIVCDAHDGEDIRNIDTDQCPYYKSFKDAKWKI